METLEQHLKKNRQHLSESSIKTYLSILNNLYKKMEGKGDAYEFFKEHVDRVIDFLKDEKPNLRKTKLAVLVSLLGDDKATSKLRAVMIKDANEYNEALRSQKMNEKQQQNWISQDEVLNVYKALAKKAAPLFKKEKVNKAEYGAIMDYVLLSLYVLLPPRRSQDFSEMKLRNYNTDDDNYYDGKHFIFRKYKTSKSYGTQEVLVPPKLRNILKTWMKFNTHDFLLSSYAGNKISVSRITLLLNKIFGKNISTSMLRHIFLTDKLKDTPMLKERDNLAEEMGHSVAQAELYRLEPK